MNNSTALNNQARAPLSSDLLSSMQRFSKIQSAAAQTPSFVIYKVKAGDTLGTIIAKRYNILYKNPRYREAEATVLYFNPAIENKDLIYAGQLIRLYPIGAESKVNLAEKTASNVEKNSPSDLKDNATTQEQSAWAQKYQQSRREELAENFTHHGSGALPSGHSLDFHKPMTPDEEEAMWMLAWLMENYYSPASIAAGAGLNSFGALVSPANNQYLKDMKTTFDQRTRGEITRNFTENV